MIVGTPVVHVPGAGATGSRVGAASDVFSLGLRDRVRRDRDRPVRPRRRRHRCCTGWCTRIPVITEVPGGLRGLAVGCLAKRPADRPTLAELQAGDRRGPGPRRRGRAGLILARGRDRAHPLAPGPAHHRTAGDTRRPRARLIGSGPITRAPRGSRRDRWGIPRQPGIPSWPRRPPWPGAPPPAAGSTAPAARTTAAAGTVAPAAGSHPAGGRVHRVGWLRDHRGCRPHLNGSGGGRARAAWPPGPSRPRRPAPGLACPPIRSSGLVPGTGSPSTGGPGTASPLSQPVPA